MDYARPGGDLDLKEAVSTMIIGGTVGTAIGLAVVFAGYALFLMIFGFRVPDDIFPVLQSILR